MSGIYPAQILKENVVRWIKAPPLDAKDTASSKVIMMLREFRSVKSNGEMTKITFLRS